MDYEWKPPLRGIGTILAREVGTSRGRGFATSERGTSAMPILSFRPSPPLPPGKGYLGAKAQSKATLVGAALISASVSPLFRALMINTHCGQCSVSVVVDPRW